MWRVLKGTLGSRKKKRERAEGKNVDKENGISVKISKWWKGRPSRQPMVMEGDKNEKHSRSDYKDLVAGNKTGTRKGSSTQAEA